jgi:hypothetical protein
MEGCSVPILGLYYYNNNILHESIVPQGVANPSGSFFNGVFIFIKEKLFSIHSHPVI